MPRSVTLLALILASTAFSADILVKPGGLEEAVAQACAALGAGPADHREAAVRLWAAVHGPVTLELEGITPFDSQGERLTRLAVTDVLAGLGLATALK